MHMNNECRLCGSGELRQFLHFGRVPISRYFRKEVQFTIPTVHINVVKCRNCGLIQTSDIPDLDELYQSEFYSTSFQKPKHIPDLLATAYSMSSPSNVFDIGANDGALMSQIKQIHPTVNVSGIEPNGHCRKIAKDQGFDVLPGYFDTTRVDEIVGDFGKFDIVFCRHVLEHVPNIKDFLIASSAILEDDGILVVEVPDVDEGFKAGNPVIIWEEHVNYMTQELLCNLFVKLGFEILCSRTYVFGGGAIAFFLRKTNPVAASYKLSDLDDRGLYENFASRIELVAKNTQKLIHAFKKDGKDVVLYGCGPRSSTFINFCGIGNLIDFCIDDRVELSDLYLPGTNSPISSFKDACSSLCSDPLVLLGVGAETEFLIKERLQNNYLNPVFLSLFHPKDLEGQLELLI